MPFFLYSFSVIVQLSNFPFVHSFGLTSHVAVNNMAVGLFLITAIIIEGRQLDLFGVIFLRALHVFLNLVYQLKQLYDPSVWT